LSKGCFKIFDFRGRTGRRITYEPGQNAILDGRSQVDPLVVRRFAPCKQRMESAAPLSRARSVRDNKKLSALTSNPWNPAKLPQHPTSSLITHFGITPRTTAG